MWLSSLFWGRVVFILFKGEGGGALLIQAFKYSNLNIINYLIKWKEN